MCSQISWEKSENYVEIVTNMLTAFEEMKCNMSLKVHFLHSYLNFFPKNLGAVSDEHGKRFHKDISKFEERYKRKIMPNILTIYCWNIVRDTPQTYCKRKSECKILKRKLH